MHARTLVLAVFLALAATSAAAQRPGVTPPRALVRQLYADLEEDHDFKLRGIDSLAAGIFVERQEFNDDGNPEWVVTGTRFCGTNCEHWVYRRLPDGRFVQLYDGWGTGVATRPGRSRGWRHISMYQHMSASDGPESISVFDGRRYRWRETLYRESRAGVEGDTMRIVYRVSVAPPAARGRRRLALDPVDAGGGLRISAFHDACATRAARCSAPELRLTSPRLPAGRACVALRIRVGWSADSTVTTSTLCGTPTPGARGARTLVLRPSGQDWARMAVGRLRLAGAAVPARPEQYALDGMRSFAGHLSKLYRLPCVPGYWCEDWKS